ncbi:nucleotidyltransferase family protein [Cyanobium sp. ATX 6A2]|uniref:nucleotidyltransferase family protein n=1 Tax=Cyanobium sp. ATX 6A2 TaxID=2823700 RepID=UPI0020CC8E98|nr:nucleotidyltransferase family protein [Cyanobium sp. ATX 6A2]MCP9888688.1 nucleotidyltransferase family protein [Cyanobium sp. ATX 6A2]
MLMGLNPGLGALNAATPSQAARLIGELTQLAGDRLLPALPILERRGLVPPELADLAAWGGAEHQGGNHPAADRVVIEALERAGLRVLVLKGTLLAHTVYDTQAQRLRSDTDLLVAPHQRQAAQAVLERLGLTPNRAPMVLTMEAQDGWQGSIHRHPVLIDLHWHLFSHPAFAPLFSFEALWRRRQAITIAGHHTFGLGPVDALLHSALHYFAHHDEGDRPAQWLLDGDLLWQRMNAADRRSAVARAIDLEVAGVVGAFLERANTRFHTGIPPAVLAELHQAGQDQWRSAITRIDGRPLAAQILILRGMQGWRARLRYLRGQIVPSRRYMLSKYPDASSWGLPWLYIRRGVEGWRERVRRQR